MPFDPGPLLAGLVLMIGSALIGARSVKKLIVVMEAKHELKQGSAGFIRSIGGWSVIAFWLGGTWFVATILGDWSVSGSLDAAFARSFARLEILLQILAAIAESDN